MKTNTGKAVRNVLFFLLLLAVSVSLVACGGGGGSTAGSSGVTQGVVTGFGSVYIDGVKYETSGSTMRKNLDDGTSMTSVPDSSVFKIGMVVKIRHGADDHVATEIDYRDLLKGPVANKNPLDNTFKVFGVKVYTDGNTKFFDSHDAGLNFSTLANGDIVELSGLIDGAGAIHATYVERKPAGTGFEIKGFVRNLDKVLRTFTLALESTASGGVPVTYDGSTQFEDMTSSAFDNGVFVEVKTASTSAPIYAQKIEREEDDEAEAMGTDRMDIEGFPTGINPASKTFKLSGVSVATSGSTMYVDRMGMGRSGFADITASARLEAEGAMSGGVLQAEKITFK